MAYPQYNVNALGSSQIQSPSPVIGAPAMNLAGTTSSGILRSPSMPMTTPVVATTYAGSVPVSSVPAAAAPPMVYTTPAAPMAAPTEADAVPVATSSTANQDGAVLSSRFDDHSNRWHTGDMTITLEPEFYTAAFVSPLQLHQQRKWYEKMSGEAFFTIGMLAVAIMQCLTVFGMASYLAEKDSGYMDEFKLGTGLFTTGGATLSSADQKSLCGNFNHIGLNQLTGDKTLAMTDGTSFGGTSDMPVFHSYKMPSGTWTFNSVSGDESYIDKQLRVVHDVNWGNTFEYFSHFRVEYGVLLVIMVGWLWYHVLYEIRKIVKFVFVLNHFYGEGLVKDGDETTVLDSETGEITIIGLNRNAFLVGYLSAIMRITVSIMMLIWGTSLLCASWNKLSLVLNSLAIGIVFELDVIIAYAVIDHNTMNRIENIQPVTISTLRHTMHTGFYMDLFFSIIMLVGVFIGAMWVRYHQVHGHVHQLHNAASLCLFAGPTPQGRTDIMAPVPGFCESLLSLTCAPSVTGTGSHHGPCLVTNQNVFRDRSVMMYADSDLFEDMRDANGKRRSMADWGRPSSKLLDSKTWTDDQYLNTFRRVCAQLYHPEANLDNRVVDPSLGMTKYSAPFYCPRDELFSAVFGNVKGDFNKWASTLDLKSPKIVAALDQCHYAHIPPLPPVGASPAGAPAGAPGPAATPTGITAPTAATKPPPVDHSVPQSAKLLIHKPSKWQKRLRAARHRAQHKLQPVHDHAHREVYQRVITKKKTKKPEP